MMSGRVDGNPSQGLLAARAQAIVGIVLLAIGLGTLPLSAAAFGLMEAYGRALQHDPSYQAAMKERDAGRQERAIGRAGLLPQLSFQYSNSRNNAEVTQPGFFGGTTTEERNYRSYSSQLTLQQALFDWEAISNYYYGVAQAHYADERFRARSQELAVRVTQAYTEVLYARDQIDLARAQKRAYAEQMRLNEGRLAAGEGNRTDVLETQARYDLAQAQEIEAQDSLDAALRELQAMTGQAVGDENLFPMRERFELLTLEPSGFEDWRALALVHNPELLALGHAIDAAGRNVQKAKAGHLPRVSLYATTGRNRSSSESTYGQRYVTNSIGVQVSIPIFAGGGVSAGVSQAVDNEYRLRYERDAARNETLNELRKQFNLCNSSAAKIRAYQYAVESARELTTAMKKSVAGGERVNADVLDAEQQYFDALRNLAQARYAYLTAWLQLKYYAGILTQDDVRTLADYFQPWSGTVPVAERNSLD